MLCVFYHNLRKSKLEGFSQGYVRKATCREISVVFVK